MELLDAVNFTVLMSTDHITLMKLDLSKWVKLLGIGQLGGAMIGFLMHAQGSVVSIDGP